MAKVTPWLLGKHHTTLTLTGMTEAANGDLTPSASVATVVAVADSVESVKERELDQVVPSTAARQHNVPTVDGHSMTVSIIEVNDTNDPDPLEVLSDLFDYVKVVWVRGTKTGSILTVTAHYAWATHRTGLSGKGQQIATMALAAADTGADSYARVKT